MNTKTLLGIITFILIFSSLIGFSQENRLNKIVATLDVGGNSGGYSLNAEFELLSNNKFSINSRLGFGYLPIENSQFVTIPIGFNVINGSGKHHFEGGIGTSYIQGLTFRPILINDSEKFYADKALYLVPSIGYRFDKLTQGLIFKVYYSPLIIIQDLLNEEDLINDITKDVITLGEATKRDWFDYFYGDEFIPKATNHFGYFGFSIGYRF